jgi:hypothetical protein
MLIEKLKLEYVSGCQLYVGLYEYIKNIFNNVGVLFFARYKYSYAIDPVMIPLAPG